MKYLLWVEEVFLVRICLVGDRGRSSLDYFLHGCCYMSLNAIAVKINLRDAFNLPQISEVALPLTCVSLNQRNVKQQWK